MNKLKKRKPTKIKIGPTAKIQMKIESIPSVLEGLNVEPRLIVS